MDVTWEAASYSIINTSVPVMLPLRFTRNSYHVKKPMSLPAAIQIYLRGCEFLLEVGNLNLGSLGLSWLGLHGRHQLGQVICLSDTESNA